MKTKEHVKQVVYSAKKFGEMLANSFSPRAIELRDQLQAYWIDVNIDALKEHMGEAWQGAAEVYSDASQESLILKHLHQIHDSLDGNVAGIGAGILLEGGGVGIAVLGGTIGIPLIAITSLIGLAVRERGGRELDFLWTQWQSAAKRSEVGQESKAQARTAAQAVMTQAEIERIMGDQHYQILMQAFDSAKRQLCIRSAFISRHVVDDAFISKVHSTLARGVTIYIEYGYRLPKEIVKPSASREHAIHALRGLWGWYRANNTPGNLVIGETPTHIKELIVDDHYIVIGSNNWLSNRSFQNKEVSIKLHDSKMCNKAFHETLDTLQHYANGW